MKPVPPVPPVTHIPAKSSGLPGSSAFAGGVGVDYLRQRVLLECPDLKPELYRFLQQVFARDELVLAFFHAGGGDGDGLAPYTRVSQAARYASQSSLVQPQYRGLVHMLALLRPCGMLLSRYQAFELHRLQGQRHLSGPSYWREQSEILLMSALMELRLTDDSLARLVMALLGLVRSGRLATPGTGSLDADQYSRLATAHLLGRLRAGAKWQGA
jgi:hypothetical protein